MCRTQAPHLLCAASVWNLRENGIDLSPFQYYPFIIVDMCYKILFFDLDDTLYDSSNGLWEAIRARMGLYMFERLRLPPDQVPILRRKYFETYGTTLRGLQIHHQVDANDYLNYVHDLPLENFLRPDPQLRTMLLRLPQAKWIFTNADADHARRVMRILGVEDCFQGIIDVRALGFHCKPEVAAYQLAMKLAGEEDPRRCVLIDDSARNLAVARWLGFTTVLVGRDGADPSADYSIPRIHDLPKAIPELFDEA
jgi:pyrimidine 5'-nucleotidase